MSPELSPSSRLTGTITIVLTLIGWSSIPLFLRYFVEDIDAWTSNGWRYGISALIWAPYLLYTMRRGRAPGWIWAAAIVPSIFNACGQVFFTWAHYKIDPGLLTFGLRSQMVFVAVGAYLLFPQERRVILSFRYLGGLAAVALGTGMAVFAGKNPLDSLHLTGVLMSVGSGALFAGYGLMVRKYMHGVHAVTAFAVISQYTAGAMVLLMFALGEQAGATALALPRFDFWLLILSAIIGIALGHVLYYISINRLGVAISAGVLQLHPFVVAVASLLIFKEVLVQWQWVGGCLALVGAVVMLSAQRRLGPALRNISPSPVRSSAT
jgi:drug/metabolite transporter (DMT)-like permease